MRLRGSLALSLLPASCLSAPKGARETSVPAETSALRCEDRGGVAAAVDRYFELLSGPSGQPRARAGFRALFLPTARLDVIGIDAEGRNQLYPQTPAEFIEHVDAYVAGVGFYQRDRDREVRCHGRIASVLTTFESRNRPEDGPIDCGRMSLHLLHDGSGWKIAHVMWHSEGAQGRSAAAADAEQASIEACRRRIAGPDDESRRARSNHVIRMCR